MFQSLFLWNSRPDKDGLDLYHRGVGVSILVFVELAPGLNRRRRHSHFILVSILVFVELAPGRKQNPKLGRTGDVSILVFVELAPGPCGGVQARRC